MATFDELRSKLNGKQIAFVDALIADPKRRAAVAYKQAGYDGKCGDEGGSRVLKNPKVQACLLAYDKESSKRVNLNADRVLREIIAVAFSSATDVADWDEKGMQLRRSSGLPRRVAAAIASVSVDVRADGTIKQSFKLHNKLDALDKLCRRLGLYEQIKEIETEDGRRYRVTMVGGEDK